MRRVPNVSRIFHYGINVSHRSLRALRIVLCSHREARHLVRIVRSQGILILSHVRLVAHHPSILHLGPRMSNRHRAGCIRAHYHFRYFLSNNLMLNVLRFSFLNTVVGLHLRPFSLYQRNVLLSRAGSILSTKRGVFLGVQAGHVRINLSAFNGLRIFLSLFRSSVGRVARIARHVTLRLGAKGLIARLGLRRPRLFGNFGVPYIRRFSDPSIKVGLFG